VGLLGEQVHYPAHTLSDGSAAPAPSGSTAQLPAAMPGVKQQPGQEGAIYDLLARALAQQQDPYQVIPAQMAGMHAQITRTQTQIMSTSTQIMRQRTHKERALTHI
jgi:hypothetical protein